MAIDNFWDDPAYYESIGYDPTSYVPSNYDYVDTSFTLPDYSWADTDYGSFWDSPTLDLSSAIGSKLPYNWGNWDLQAADYLASAYPELMGTDNSLQWQLDAMGQDALYNTLKEQYDAGQISLSEFENMMAGLTGEGETYDFASPEQRAAMAAQRGALPGAVKAAGTAAAQQSYRSQLGELLAKQVLQQLQAKQKYQSSGVGQATAGLAMATKLAQDLIGKNKGATTSRRANQGQAFSPIYIGASEPKTKYADGGKVESSPCRGGLLNVAERLMNAMMQEYERTGRKGLIQGEAGGQDDVVDIKAAPGEYIMDAEIVSALGDGSNEEGARKLDEMRMNVRKHKRKGGLTSIPPKSKRPEQYLNEEY